MYNLYISQFHFLHTRLPYSRDGNGQSLYCRGLENNSYPPRSKFTYNKSHQFTFLTPLKDQRTSSSGRNWEYHQHPWIYSTLWIHMREIFGACGCQRESVVKLSNKIVYLMSSKNIKHQSSFTRKEAKSLCCV